MGHVTQMAVACSNAVHLPHVIVTTDVRPGLPWYALCIRQKQREQCEQFLAAQEYEFFSPTRVEVRQWSDRRKAILLPLFPGYIFCRFDANKSAPILRAPGVTTIIHAGGTLIEVEAQQIDAVRRSLQSGVNLDVMQGLVRGQRVQITSGPMAGIEGVLAVIKHRLRVGLEITMMNRSVLLEVNPAQLLPL